MHRSLVWFAVNEQAGYAYLNMPKCACTSIKSAIALHVGLSKSLTERDDAYVDLRHHASVGEVAHRHDLFRFTVVRNPFDRLVSFWADYLQPPYPEFALRANPDLMKWKGLDFDVFVGMVVEQPTHQVNPHVAPQTEFTVVDGRHVVDHVFRFERLKDFRRIMSRAFGLPNIPHFRKTPHEPYASLYDRHTVAMVVEKYGRDFAAFGYPTKLEEA